ncbi:potassium/sodium hyperpolarization-activated cyclic nucleotide-gated channel 2-like [Glandiceps talaboti]
MADQEIPYIVDDSVAKSAQSSSTGMENSKEMTGTLRQPSDVISLESKVNMVIDQLGVTDSKVRHIGRPSHFKTNFSKTTEVIFQASASSKMGMRMFRSQRAIEEERQRQRDNNKFVIHPFSPFRWYWDMFVVILLILTLILMPVNIAFFSDSFNIEWISINCVTDTIFMIDIFLNFFTGVIHHENEEIILKRSKIASSYMRGWFVLDLLSSFPFDYIYIGFSGNSDYNQTALALKSLRLTKIISLLRLLRLSRLLRYVHRLEEVLKVEGAVIRIMNLVLVILVLTHWNGCLQFLIPFLMGFPSDSWVVREGLVDASKWEQYSWSFFKAICQTLSIGFGSHPPTNISDMWATTVSMMIGASFYALFIGHMSTLLLSIDASGRFYNERINQVKEYMRYRKLPLETQHRILEYYEQRYQRHYFDEDSILQEQNHPLRKEIIQMNCKQLVSKVDFLKNAPKEFTYDIIQKLRYEVYLPGDHIIKAGNRGDRMYFIEHGTVDVIVGREVVTQLGDGDHFGEIAILVDDRRVASVISATTAYVYYLKREDFGAVLADYPDVRQVMKEIATERLKKIGKLPAESPDTNGPVSISSSMTFRGSVEPQSQRLGELTSLFSDEDITRPPTGDGTCVTPAPVRGNRQTTVTSLQPVIEFEVTPSVDN